MSACVTFALSARAGLVSGILASQASWKYSAVCCSTILAYSAYTIGVTQWRTKFRRQMIALENEASAKVREVVFCLCSLRVMAERGSATSRILPCSAPPLRP